jgi:hypothetical protein
MTNAREELARDIIQYVMSNDILTQHGMKGLRTRLAAAIPDDIAVVYDAMLCRASRLMDAKLGEARGRELDILVSAIEAYEVKNLGLGWATGKAKP